MTRLALLPLDDRPVNYDHPWWLGRAAGIDVIRPPREWLGTPVHAADARLADWLRDESHAADCLVIAIDTLAYGGLIPSRQGTTPLNAVVDALEPLRAIRASRRDLPIFAFSILMRVNRSNSAEEEKPYWARHGRDLFRLSYLADKSAGGEANDKEEAERRALSTAIPAEIVDDYRAGRARNHAINRLALDWLRDGTLDYALIAQDDTAPWGWNIAEARALRDLITRHGLGDRAAVYPGTDEVAGLLVAAAACKQAGFGPRVLARYSGVDGPRTVTSYEDRPFEELIKAHLGPLGGRIALGPGESDIVLAVNAPAEEQAEAWLQLAVREPDRVASAVRAGSVDAETIRAVRREMSTVRRDLNEFTRAIVADLSAQRTVAVIDVAFVNGADLALGERLLAAVPVARLAAFSAWNTAGNSLGSGLAQAVVREIARRGSSTAEARAAHLSLLFVHLLDDYAFQSRVRTELLLDDLPEFGLKPSFERLPPDALPEIEARLARRLRPHVEALARAFTAESTPPDVRARTVEIGDPTLPWHRLFEVALEPRLEVE